MCAVIGAFVNKPQEKDFKIIENIFLESKIRGLHATGLSYVKNDKILTIKYAISADEFIKKVNIRNLVNEDGNLYLIGHCRYSTSDLEYNQPIADDELSVVHNGVITQEPYEKWERHFGLKCEGKNDTELLFQTLKKTKDISEIHEKWPNSSIAAISLDKYKIIKWFRNGKRPLYYAMNDTQAFIFSTKDIAKRANVPGEYYKILAEKDLQC